MNPTTQRAARTLDPTIYNDYERVMRPTEIAPFLGVSERTIQRLLKNGTLPRVRIGLRATGARRGDVIALRDGVTE
jgi:excisionase family DNA binding protein